LFKLPFFSILNTQKQALNQLTTTEWKSVKIKTTLFSEDVNKKMINRKYLSSITYVFFFKFCRQNVKRTFNISISICDNHRLPCKLLLRYSLRKQNYNWEKKKRVFKK